MTGILNNFAEAAGGNMFASLGIDWKMLVFQTVAFLILVWILAKWVFPPLMSAVDSRQKNIEEATKAADQAREKAEKAEANVEDALKDARKEAADIVATAKTEASQIAETADVKAKERADRIVAEAHEDIQKDVLAARRALEKDTLNLVKKAAGLTIAGVADSKIDTAIVKKSVEGAKK